MQNFKVGDKVIIDHHGAKYKTIYWAENMDKHVGKKGKVLAINGCADGHNGLQIEVNGDAWWYPTECVKHAPKRIRKRIRKPSPPIRIGDRFSYSGELYILAQVGSFALALINLKNGNRWVNKVECKDPYNVSKKEFAAIALNEFDDRKFIRKYCYKD